MCNLHVDWTAAADAADRVVLDSRMPIAKVLDPTKDADFVKIVAHLAREIEATRRRATKVSLKNAIDALDVDWPNLSVPARVAVMDAANRAVTLAEARAIPKMVSKIQTRTTAVAKASKKVIGVQHKVSVVTSFDAVDKKIIKSIARQGTFFRDAAGQRSVAFTRVGQRIIEDGLADGLRTSEITKKLSAAARQVHFGRPAHYMRVVASQAVNSARIYGELSGLREAGIEEYIFWAVMDERTTEICSMMHEKRFRTDDALNRYRDIADSPDPEIVYDLKPWVRERRDPVSGNKELYVQDRNQVQTRIATVDTPSVGQKDRAGTYSNVIPLATMDQLGISYPPLHGLCRSTVVSA